MGFIHAALPSGKRLVFGLRCNGPDDAQPFPGESHYDLVLVLASRRSCLVTLVQTVLGLPDNRFDFLAQSQILLPPRK